MERETLTGYLDSQRKHVLGILDGLGEGQLREVVLPSGWSPRDLVHHLTWSEALWFRGAMAADRQVIDTLVEGEFGWKVPEELSGADVLARYRRTIELSNMVIGATAIDAAPAWWPTKMFGSGSWRLDSLREVLLHVIVDTATHAGQLDAVRELIDGRQWLVNDD
ncbi:DinB family protein [Nonomuraea monospora]|uniref:DinB family protein n=1 Tax=Nonomuraea monospora TaxID=568818 RepID=A0ABN3CTE7_9ACTN